ncbi:MAG: outer membrane protein assembly factor BamA [Candidatus Omnitrophica bacterium]|nr:outer membrane protein assembly factor BamA [Candidatus Omnitrophota bacterium]
MKKRLAAAFVCMAFLITNFPQGAFPQSYDNDGKTIISVNVKNNKAISQETVLSKVKMKQGEIFRQDIANEDIKRLYATQYFTDVSIDVSRAAEGVSVTFVVDEKPVIADITFTGNKAFRANKLKGSMKSKPNEMLNLALLTQDIADIREMYVKKGYPLVEAKYEIEMDKTDNKAMINVTIDEKTRVKVSSVNIIGNKAIKTDVIKKAMSTRPASWIFFTPGIFKEEGFQDDIDNIKAMYDDIGYLDIEVTPKLDYKNDGTTLDITLDINEGKLYTVGDVTVTGNLVLPEKNVWAKISSKPGKPFSVRAIRNDTVNIRQYYFEYGYLNVVIDAERNLNQTTGKIDISINIDPKDIVYVGKIEVRGNQKTREIIIRREVRVYPGERFNGDKIKRSKERIYNLGFFENVSFDTEPTEVPNIQNLIVTVKETKTGEFSFGGGYSSVDMLVGFVEITQRNFDILNFPTFTGGGQNLAIKAELGMVRNNFNLSWTDPWILGFPYLFGFDAYRASHNQSGDLGWMYDETRTGGDLRLGKELTERLYAMATYKLEDVNISNVVSNASQGIKDEEGSNWISSLLFELTYDDRDNIYNPSKGFLVNGTLEDAGGIFFGDKNFVKGTATVALYHTFFEKVVVELKGRAGMVGPYGDSSYVPIYERFYAGGQNTIRGYKERRVGPRDSGSNEPVGGEAIMIVNAEVTFPVYEKIIKGAVFYDIGNVWEHTGDFMTVGDFKAGAGVGVRVKTPVGPVRVDYGYPLSANYDKSETGEFYFSMSRGF